jgi:hypothetical protein
MAKTETPPALQMVEPPASASDLDLQSQLGTLRDEMRQRIVEKIAKGETIDANVQMLKDPFTSRNPHQIKAHPPDKVLSWKNPRYRQERGWRGWSPVSYDDEIGRTLSSYIDGPPHKMEGSATLDNYVRRGTDSVLCWIPKDVWLARQLEQSRRALEAEARAAMRGQIAIRSGVMLTGDGGVKQSTGRDKSQREIDGELMGSREMLSQE